jgi:hypothetical protein
MDQLISFLEIIALKSSREVNSIESCFIQRDTNQRHVLEKIDETIFSRCLYTMIKERNPVRWLTRLAQIYAQ